jgi:hypothetical protein
MPPLSTAFASVREFFVLRGAERAIRGYAAAQQARVRAHAAAAESRLLAGRRVCRDVPASALLLEAVRHYLLAAEAARDPGLGDDTPGSAALPPLPPDPARPDADPSDDERVRAALSSPDSLFLDRLSPEDAARTRAALERAASLLGGRVEARTLTNIQGARWGRLAAIGLVAVYGAVVAARAVWMPKNVARGKPVHPSSTRHGDGHELVDGELDTVPGVMTGIEDSPNVVIDLMDVYAVDEVRVHNRLDAAFDDCLPLAVEISLDGAVYKELGRQDQHFAADPPWVVPGNRAAAHFVRLKVLRRGYLALSEVEVYGKKLATPPSH